MKKKLYNLFIILVCAFFISSIIKTVNHRSVSVANTEINQNHYQDVTKMLLNLETYAMAGTVTYISSDDESTYKLLQYAKNDGTYRAETLNDDGSKLITIYDTKTIFQYSDDMKGVVNVSTDENSERSEIFITKFIKNYENSKDVSVLVSNVNDTACTVLEATIPGNNHYFATEKLFVDNKELLPVKLVIYDEDGLERVIVNYSQFIENPTLDEEIFSVKSSDK